MEKTFDDLKAGLRAIRTQSGGDISGLVLDLRNNPGGLLTQAIKVSDMFLKEGVIVYTDGRVEAQKQKFFAHSRDTEPGYPIVVLVNGGSASASEIVAGALKDHGRALILGTQTFGKGSVQTITPLENGGALTLTTALYYTKSGNSIQATGVKPDIEIDAPEEALEEPTAPKQSLRVRESDLPGAISNPSGGGRGDEPAMNRLNKVPTTKSEADAINPETEELEVWLGRDPQLQKAFDLLKTFNIFKGPIQQTMTEDGRSKS
jgi:carboxyl-terminal processing protease